MAMPKKGSRKIVVDGKEYRYVVKPSTIPGHEESGGRLIVEVGGVVRQKNFYNSVTPSKVELFIRNVLVETAK